MSKCYDCKKEVKSGEFRCDKCFKKVEEGKIKYSDTGHWGRKNHFGSKSTLTEK